MKILSSVWIQPKNIGQPYWKYAFNSIQIFLFLEITIIYLSTTIASRRILSTKQKKLTVSFHQLLGFWNK